MTTPPRTPDPPWWSRPDFFLAFVIVPLALAVCAVTPGIITNNHARYDAPLFVGTFYFLLFVGGVVVLLLGAIWGMRMSARREELRFADGCLDVLFWVCFLAYAIWFGPVLISAPGLFFGALLAQTGAVYEIRELAPNFSGITTATQFGISFSCIYAMKRFVLAEPIARRYDFYFGVIVVMAVLRAFVYSERLALIEIVFPTIVILCRGGLLTTWLPFRAFRATFPLLVLFAAPVFFTVFEYNRSWINHYQYIYDSVQAFGLERLGIYFASSLNNMAGYLSEHAWPLLDGEATLRWLYRFPLVGELVGMITEPSFERTFLAFLDKYGIGEFNNPTGVMLAYLDWGLVGGVVFLLLYGVFAGRAFVSFRELRGFLQYFYPVVLYSLFEILRIGYLYEGRSFAALIGLVVAYVGWGRVSRPNAPASETVVRPGAPRAA